MASFGSPSASSPFGMQVPATSMMSQMNDPFGMGGTQPGQGGGFLGQWANSGDPTGMAAYLAVGGGTPLYNNVMGGK